MFPDNNTIENFNTSIDIYKGVPVDSHTQLLAYTLWIFSSVFSATKIDFNSHITGVSFGFSRKYAYLILLTSWLLHMGIRKGMIALVLPWIIVTASGIYHNHYKNLINMIGVLIILGESSAMSWISLFVAYVTLVVRFFLILRTIQLSVYVWYMRSIEHERFAPINSKLFV